GAAEITRIVTTVVAVGPSATRLRVTGEAAAAVARRSASSGISPTNRPPVKSAHSAIRASRASRPPQPSHQRSARARPGDPGPPAFRCAPAPARSVEWTAVCGPRRSIVGRPRGTVVALRPSSANTVPGDAPMNAPGTYRSRGHEPYRVDVGYLLAFMIVLGVLAGVGYHIYHSTRVSVDDIQWPDPLSLGRSKTQQRLADTA